MKKITTLFDFSGTISGMTYFSRPFLSIPFVFICFLLIRLIHELANTINKSSDVRLIGKDHIMIELPEFFLYWWAILIPTWLWLSTTVKRARSITVRHTTTINTLIILLVPFAFWWALFENSKIDNHAG